MASKDFRMVRMSKPKHRVFFNRIANVVKPYLPGALKKIGIVKTVQVRAAIGKPRALPDFIIIGAQRSGSTSLYSYLAEHPSVSPTLHKEIHFFDEYFDRGIEWYKAHFDSVDYVKSHNLITGEASPYYILDPNVPEKIARLIPNVKLIALLRNPINRAYSHHNTRFKSGKERLLFEDVIKKEIEALSRHNGNGYHAFLKSYETIPYLSRCIYADQLQPWLDVFPREQLLILRSEDLYTDTPNTYKDVLQFLNLPLWEPKNYPAHERMQYAPMSMEARKLLIEFFTPHNERLYKMLNRDLQWDKRSAPRATGGKGFLIASLLFYSAIWLASALKFTNATGTA
jgi:hypothetical protein